MAGQELTRDEVFALAGAFPVGSAKTLLSLACFPSWAVPEAGYANGREFWVKVSEQLGAGVMPDGRVKILEAARDWFPANERLAALAAPTAPPAETAPLRVLVVGASPLDPDLPHVRADREAHAIGQMVAPGRMELEVILGAEATDVRRVGIFRPDIVHFICHGTADSLVFSDADGESDYVTAARVAQRLRFYRDERGVRLRGVVLAACDGETLAPFFANVADTVIAHRGKLADPCGVAFAEQFYALLNAPAGQAASSDATPGRAVARRPASDLADAAHEAAQLTAQYSAACDPVIANLIVLPDGG